MRRFIKIFAIALLLIFVVAAIGIFYTSGPSLSCFFPKVGPLQPGTSARTLLSGERERCYLLYVPDEFDPSKPIPVVFSLHGFASNPAGQRFISRWERIADRETFLVVYPQGSSFPLRWNSGLFANINEIDDVQFMRDMIAELRSLATLDPDRIYVTGMSNGAMMTDRIACELADQVAAVGLVSGLGAGASDECAPARPVAVMGFFGSADPLIDFKTGLGRISVPRRALNIASQHALILPLDEWTKAWVERNGCNPDPEVLPTQGDVSGVRYSECAAGAEVIVYTIDGGGHNWPGGPDIPYIGKTTHAIDASQAMWDFFQAHPLNRD